jgi:hypothetical protein
MIIATGLQGAFVYEKEKAKTSVPMYPMVGGWLPMHGAPLLGAGADQVIPMSVQM